MTGVGVILGTAAYMAPEQAKGFVADHRSDIFSFGCVLYETLAGKQAFEGDTVSDVLASIIAREPDFTRLPSNLHPRLLELLQRCLAKNPRRRWHAAGDLRIELESAAGAPTASTSPGPHPRARPLLQLVTLIATTGLAAGLAWWFKPALQTGMTDVTRFEIQVPLGGVSRGVVASISRDGSKIAYVGNNRIWVRPLSMLTSTEVQGSENGSGLGSPVFSPDGRSIAFWGGGRNPGIRIVPAVGGAAALVCPTAPVTGLVWNGDSLLFGQTNIVGNTNPRITQPGIYRVLARNGGQAELVVAAERDEILAHPFLLPDGDTLLMTSASATHFDRWTQARIEAYSIKAASRRVVVDGGADARYLPTGHIVYALGGILFAAPFDAARRELKGSGVAVVEGVNRGLAFSEGISQFWVSDGGTLIYQPGPATTRTIFNGIVVSERQGRMQALKLPESPYESPRVSPDGTGRVAYVIDDGQQAHIWIAPLDGSTQPSRLTFEGRNRFPVWSPDGTRIAFQSNRDGGLAIYLQRAEPGRAERLTTPDANVEHVPESWTRAGDLLSYSAVGEQGASLWTMAVGDRKATQIPNVTSQWPLNSTFSPDGHWLAYGTRPRGGGANIYVQAMPPRPEPYQLTDGIPAHHPMWSPDGTEIFFFSGTSPLLSIPVTTRPAFTWRAPVAVAGGFQPITTIVSGPNFDITPSAKQFVFIGYPNQYGGVDVRSDQQLNVVLSWFDVLKAAFN